MAKQYGSVRSGIIQISQNTKKHGLNTNSENKDDLNTQCNNANEI